MSNGSDVFLQKVEVIERDKAIKVIKRPLEKSWIKERTQGKAKLSYIGGNTVINLLNEAFDYAWSFEIVSEEVVESLPKPMFSGWGNNRKPVLDSNGNQKMEPQAPVAKVLGRLTVPGFGVKEQYGSKVIIGGASEQESCFKAASTDALKKCATLFGIGIQLYEDDSVPSESTTSTPHQSQKKTVSAPEVSRATQAKSSSVQTATQTQQEKPTWDTADVNKMKELMKILGMTKKEELDPYFREFLDDPNASYRSLTPMNNKAFNVFLEKKANDN